VGRERVAHDFRDGQVHAVDRDGVTETCIGEHLWRAHAQHPCAGLDNLANFFNDSGEHLSSSPHDAAASQAPTVASSASPPNAHVERPEREQRERPVAAAWC